MTSEAGDEPIVLDETIHQSTRLRIMTMLVSVPESDRLAYGFVQQTLGLTGGNLTTHLRRLEEAGYLSPRRSSSMPGRAPGCRRRRRDAAPSRSTSPTCSVR